MAVEINQFVAVIVRHLSGIVPASNRFSVMVGLPLAFIASVFALNDEVSESLGY